LLHRLKMCKREEKGDPSALFEGDRKLAHLWQEYKDTLHKQTVVDARTGKTTFVAFRSTYPADVFFSPETLVDSRLRTEFFKHLPGILTGLGIIGTFLGLIHGLQGFHIDENPQVVRNGLETLLGGVFHAFLVSVAAIGLAMAVTFIEKWIVSGLYRKTEELAHFIDSMFQSGAGEEYLARLVRASESAEGQTRILKDALATDLKQILTELSERQIETIVQSGRHIGHHVSSAVQDGLKDPLNRMATAVERVSGTQSDATTKLITDVLAGFSERIQDLFGGQIAGINQLQQQTVQALQVAVVRLEQMAANVDAAGKRASDAMSTKLTEALDHMEARQRVMNDHMSEFVAQIKTLVSQSQSETNQAMQAALGSFGENVSGLIEALKRDVERASASHAEREQRMTHSTTQAVSGLSEQIASVVAQVAQMSAEMRTTVETLRATTTDAITKMNSGADTLYVAATDFAKAGQGVAGTLNQTATLTDRLTQASGALTSSSQTLQSLLADYATTKQALERMIGELRALVESAKKEASITGDVLSRIESASTALAQAQNNTDRYLERLSAALAEAHEEFAAQMRKTVGTANDDFFRSLSNATKLLGEGIQELDTTLAGFGARKRA